jgi:hypothetical protein
MINNLVIIWGITPRHITRTLVPDFSKFIVFDLCVYVCVYVCFERVMLNVSSFDAKNSNVLKVVDTKSYRYSFF